MSMPGAYSYKPNVNRAVTKKWRDANQANYDGDDWGDEDFDESALPVENAGLYPWESQASAYPTSRNVANPSPTRSGGKSSFDQNEERRFYANPGGFESHYPTSQRNPFPEPQHDYEPPNTGFRNQPPLQLQTSSGFRPSSRSEAPFSAPGSYPHRRNQPSGHSDRSPVRPDSRTSNSSSQPFPPRKSSLSQQTAPDLPFATESTSAPPSGTTEVKALPFIRPADIYKRIEEEREKERRSQESSRRSFDSANSRPRDDSRGPPGSNDGNEIPQIRTEEDNDSARRLKTTLDPVPERKSEYGFDNLVKPNDQNLSPNDNVTGGISRHGTNASSVYSDRPDPVSISRNESLRRDFPDDTETQSKSYKLPQINRFSGFGGDLGNFTADSYAAEALPSNVNEGNIKTSDDNTNSSMGYRSAVEQAFDNSQLVSPTSTNETFPRSNSASTSEISPIVSHKQEPYLENSIASQIIPEESTTNSRPTSSSTLKAASTTREPFNNKSIPIRDNSPARRTNIQTVNEAKPEEAVVGDSLSEDRNIPANIVEEPSELSNLTPKATRTTPSEDRSTSDEWREWQKERRQFNAQQGLPGSNVTTPDVPSPVSRIETPAKGTVKDMAEKLETHSGRSSPAKGSYSEHDSSLRPPQSRFDSFRPAIPGGWQSFAATPATMSPATEENKQLHTNQPKMTRFDSTESIPTAKPSNTIRNENDGISRGAFAAAAAAGTALAGAFSGRALMPNMSSDSQDTSENEWDGSSTSSKLHPVTSDARDFAVLDHSPFGNAHTPHDGTQYDTSANEGFGSVDTPRAQRFHHQIEADDHSIDSSIDSMPKDDESARSLEDITNDKPQEVKETSLDSSPSDIPAPLRTSKVLDSNTGSRSPVRDISHTDQSPIGDENDRLQDDIVRTLSPKSFAHDEIIQEQNHGPNFHESTRPDGEAESLDRSFTQGTSLDPIDEEATTTPNSSYLHVRQEPKQIESQSKPSAPYLDRRFSWQTDSDAAINAPASEEVLAPESEKTVKDITSTDDLKPSSKISITPTDERKLDSNVENDIPPPVPKDEPIVSPINSIKRQSRDYPTFRSILNLDTSQQRIQAFEDNRKTYAEHDGLLDEWLSSMKSPDHTEMFENAGQSTSIETPNKYKPSPRRDVGGSGGSKMMRQDGKRFMAAAGRFGGKAGIAAQGLFAKGKDKLRTASAGDKGNRRKSSVSIIHDSDEIKHEPGHGPQLEHKDSTSISTAPQIPPQDLSLSPVNAENWSIPSNRLDTEASRAAAVVPPLKSVPRSEEKLETPEIENSAEDLAKTSVIDHNNEEESRDLSVNEINKASSIDPDGEEDLHKETHPEELTSEVDTPRPVKSVEDMSNTNDTSGSASNAIEQHDIQNHESKVHDNQLTIPDEQRSIISKVSSISPNPEVENQHSTHRDVSLDEDRETVPSYDAVPKEVEASMDKSHDEALPVYDDASKRQIDHQRIEPNAEIIPVSDLSSQKRPGAESRQNRPFSFEGEEQLYRPGQDKPSVEGSQVPISQITNSNQPPPTNDRSQVNTAEPSYETNRNKPTKSYSRPFGGKSSSQDSNQPQQDSIGRSQRYPSLSALPSDRLPSENVLRQREAQPVNRPAEEHAYRIPGPYGQEYRSPKQSSIHRPAWSDDNERQYQNEDVAQGDELLPSSNQQQSQEQPAHSEQISQNHQQPAQIQPDIMPETSKPRQRSFGGLFKSRTRESQPTDQENQMVDVDANKQKRGSIFGLNSRNHSHTSQQSQSIEQRDQVGELPRQNTPASQARKRLSKDILRSGTPTSTDSPEGKKKRFSGIFSKFGSKADKTRVPDRSSTIPSSINHSSHAGDQHQIQNGSDQAGEQHRDEPSQSNGQFRGVPPPVGGYYSPERTTSPKQENQSYTQSTKDESQPYQQTYSQQRNLSNNTPPQQYQPETPQDRRPGDLRIDTGRNGQVRQANAYTSPTSQSYANNENSHGTRWNAPRGTAFVSKDQNEQGTQGSPDHVINLHKRSRSPKLGRKSSSEDLSQQVKAGQFENQNSAGNLGTFGGKKVSPVGGVDRAEEEQEGPYRIGIPGEQNEERKRRTRQMLIEHGRQMSNNRNDGANGNNFGSSPDTNKTVAQKIIGPQIPDNQQISPPAKSPLRTTHANAFGNNGATKGAYVAELPGSKAAGYESDEEIPMSATFYPGQEWQPIFVGDDRWDD